MFRNTGNHLDLPNLQHETTGNCCRRTYRCMCKSTFLDFREEICSDSDESLVEIAPNKQTYAYNNSKTLIEKLKSEINSNIVTEEKSFKLRI